MKAVVITGVGGLDVFEVRDVPVPAPQGNQVRVRVRACGANRAEILQAAGKYPAPADAPRDIPGLEFAGEVESLGPCVADSIGIGDRVFGLVGGGAMAEFAIVHERLLAKIPENLDFIEAAAIPEAFITALDALETQATLKPGGSVLIHAVGGGVGTAAVQIARAMGCRVFGTSRTARKLERAKTLGLEIGIDLSREDFVEVVQRETRKQGIHALIDSLGGPWMMSNLRALAPQGTLVALGLLAGSRADLDLSLVLTKRLKIVGTTLRSRPLEEKIVATRQFADAVLPWLARGLVKPTLDSVFDLDEVRAAQARLVSNLGFGKVVLRV